MSKLSTEDMALIRTCVERHAPHLVPGLQELGGRDLTNEEREGIRGALADDLVERGLAPDGEPNAYGRRLEDIIDRLGHI